VVPASYDGSLWHGDVFGMSFPRSIYCDKDLVLSLFYVGGAVGLVEEADLQFQRP